MLLYGASENNCLGLPQKRVKQVSDIQAISAAGQPQAARTHTCCLACVDALGSLAHVFRGFIYSLYPQRRYWPAVQGCPSPFPSLSWQVPAPSACSQRCHSSLCQGWDKSPYPAVVAHEDQSRDEPRPQINDEI